MDWSSVLAHIVPTPPEFRQWVTADDVRTVLRCSEPDLDDLRRSGAATLNGAFDRFDIWNAGFYSGSRNSKPELEMQLSGRLLELPGRDWISPVTFRVLVESACPRGGECDGSHWSAPAITGITWEEHDVMPGRARWAGRVHRVGARATVHAPRAVSTWHAMLRDYRYHCVPAALATSTQATRHRRVGGCTALSLVLAEELAVHGLQARMREGFLVAGFAPRVHTWAELLDSDGAWKPLDISMASLARTFFTQEYARFCFGSMLNRLVPVDIGATAFVRHQCRDGSRNLQARVTMRYERHQE
jgi:hypothetical protein